METEKNFNNNPESNEEDPLGLSAEDKELFFTLSKRLNLTEKDKKYWRLRDIIRDSHERNITGDLSRWFRESSYEFDRSIEPTIKRGYKSHALYWLKAALPEEMKYGTATKEERIQEARKWAEKAGTTLEEIAQENNIEIPG